MLPDAHHMQKKVGVSGIMLQGKLLKTSQDVYIIDLINKNRDFVAYKIVTIEF